MKVTYSLSLSTQVEVATQPQSIVIDGVTVEWQVAGRYLTAIHIVAYNWRLRRPKGRFLTQDPRLEAKVFSAASDVANLLLAQAGLDVIDPHALLGNSPTIEPETADEAKQLPRFGTTNQRSVSAYVVTSKAFDPNEFPNVINHVDALAAYAEGLRAKSPFLRYAQFYKVLEYYFERRLKVGSIQRVIIRLFPGAIKWISGWELDHAVTEYMKGIDPTYTQRELADLRQTRNRITHPRASRGHISSRQLQHIQTILDKLPRMECLAKLLLQNPPLP